MDNPKEEYRDYSKEINELVEGLSKVFTTWEPVERAKAKRSVRQLLKQHVVNK